MKIDVSCFVNGRPYAAAVPTNKTLAELLREDLRLQGCRVACDADVCGACTVIVDGKPMAACATFAFEIDGSHVETIEGLSESAARLHPIQQAFLETNAFQCGFCTAGLVISVKALLAIDPSPDDHAIQAWLGSNICRCTGYKSILAATRLAASRLRSSG